MNSETAKRIERWFADHDGDGEFACDPSMPFLVYGPSCASAPIVFATKATPVALAIDQCAACHEFGMIARYGLPRESDAVWIAALAAEHELLFLGDLDPTDLMIYAWLRERLFPKRIALLGVSDAYLTTLQVTVQESSILTCAPVEQASLAVLKEVFPDVFQIVGPACGRLLEQGRKIELEAVVSTLGSAVPILLPAIAVS